MSQRQKKVDLGNKTGGHVSIVGGVPYLGYNPKVTITVSGNVTYIDEEFQGHILRTTIEATSGQTIIDPQELIQ